MITTGAKINIYNWKSSILGDYLKELKELKENNSEEEADLKTKFNELNKGQKLLK